jgi:ABC-2 type transport system ATP-binding protein
MEYILETIGLTKIYGQKAAVSDVSMHIPAGVIYGLIGRNGAGKTTIMRMISGLSTPTKGSYSLFGKTGYAMRKELKNVGVLIESPGLLPRFSAYENLKIKCLAMGIKPQGYLEDLLKTVGLENTDRKKASGSYSLGMKQRLGIALALVGDPKMLVLDEPINGLDPQGIVEVRQSLVRLRDEKGISIMISSHILDELSRVADCYGIINEGTLLDEFSAEELHERCGKSLVLRTDNTAETLQVLENMGLRGAIHEPDGSLRLGRGMDQSKEIAKAIVGAGIGLEEIYLRTMTLEEYYLGMTRGEHNG